MPAPASGPRRSDAPELQSGWADKSDELLVKKPLYRRSWFRRLTLVLILAAVSVSIVGGLFLYRWHREQQADLARQRRGVEAFARSAAFATFAREADTQLVATINFACLQPETSGALLPEIAAAEKTRHQVPWPLELSPVPVSTSEHPDRVRTAVNRATDLLVQRGFVFDQTQIAEGRRIFLRLLTPHARAFLAENTGTSFPALFLDRRMQDIVLNAYAARSGGTREEIERMFRFYALVGPSLWEELGVNQKR